MKATDLLKKQHDEVHALFKKIERATGAHKGKLFDDLAKNLVAHDAIEREIFYPACQKAMGMTDMLGEAIAEHGVVEFMLHKADAARGEDDFEFQLTVLREMLEHHIEEEEDDFFPKVNRALGTPLLEDLCDRMKARFEESLAEENWRVGLHANMKQVLAGALKTKKPTAKNKKTSAPKPHKKAA